MPFIPAAQLSPEQLETCRAKWPPNDADPLDRYEIEFLGDGVTPFARRILPALAAATPAPAYHCQKCGQGFDSSKKLGGHARHCKGEGATIVTVPNAEAATSLTARQISPAPLDETIAAATLSAVASGADPIRPFSGDGPIAATIVFVALECLVDSPTQPRTDYSTAKHEELVASMRAHGWVKGWAALVRPIDAPAAEALPVDPNDPDGPWALYVPGSRAELFPGRTHTREEAEALVRENYSRRFEIIAGHRRKRAARAAGIHVAPVVVENLSDAAVIELQLVENLRRQDLNPMEEADALARLLALRIDGKTVHTKESLAAKVGASVKHIEHSLSLVVLEGEVREAVADGRIGVAVGYELARIPDADLRAKAAAEILNPTQGEGPMRKAAALDYIRRTCTRNLRTDAKFPTDDADLVPVQHRFDPLDGSKTIRILGGSCLDCPFNGAVSDDPSKRGPKLGICANVTCFDAKRAAHFERFRAKHNKPDAGRVVVPFERNAEIFDAEGVLSFTSGLVPLNAEPDAGLLKAGAVEGENVGTWGELVKGQVAEIIVAQDPKSGRPVELVPVELAKTAAEENGFAIFRTSKARRQNDDEHAAATLATKIENETNARTLSRLLAEIAGRANGLGHLPPGALSSLCFWAVEVVDKGALETVARRRKIEPAGFADVISTDDGARLALLAELIIADHWRANCPDLVRDFAALYGVKLADVQARARQEVEAELAPKPTDPSLPATDLWRARRWMKPEEIETGFRFLENDRCENPDSLEVILPAKASLSVILEAARVAGVWVAGYTLDGGEFSSVAAAASTGHPFPSRFSAFAEAARSVADRCNREERVSRKTRGILAQVVEDMEARALAEAELVSGDPEPQGDEWAEDQPTHFAYLTEYAAKMGQPPTVLVFDAAEWSAALNSPLVYWVAPLGGVKDLDEALSAANEALREGVGTITDKGTLEGFALPYPQSSNTEAAA